MAVTNQVRYTATNDLKTIRETRKIQQDEVAGLLRAQGWRMTRSNYARIEGSDVTVDSSLALVIARILKADIGQVFRGIGVDDR